MSLGKLLAAGKSFAGGNEGSRYRIDARSILPKFISPKNPFAPPADRDAPPRTVNPETPASSLPNQAADSGARAASSRRVPQPAARASFLKASCALVYRCVMAVNPLKLLRRRPPHAKSAIPRFNVGPVQSELTLERVQVVRNDLSESDLEVVQAGRKGGAGDKSRNENGWGRLANKIFGSETM
jgi:hypothetical protein